jgi:hypothetical protein
MNNPSVRLMDTLRTYTRMDDEEIKRNLKERQRVLRYLADNKINSVDEVGKAIINYYEDPEGLLKKIG